MSAWRRAKNFLADRGLARPTVIDPAVQDGTLEVSAKKSEERARQLAKEEGLLVGTSSGAALAASLRLAGQLDEARSWHCSRTTATATWASHTD